MHDRKSEHFKALINGHHKSALADHVTSTGHSLKWDHFEAFEKVRHDLLINKLRDAGFGGKLLDWLHPYLCDRRQRVTVLGATLRDLPVTSGVPQGSILGSALFLLYVNNLPDVVTKSQVVKFADDTKVYKEVKSQDDGATLQQDLRDNQQNVFFLVPASRFKGNLHCFNKCPLKFSMCTY